MYLYKQKKFDDQGNLIDIYLAVKEKYHVPGKGARERTIKKIGYLSQFKDKLDDPIAYFTEYAKNYAKKSDAKNTKTVRIDPNAKLKIGTDDCRNVGYVILKEIYRALKLDQFWNRAMRDRKTKFHIDQIFRLLVFSRALYPGSKRYTLNSRDQFFEPYNGISLDDIYHALDIIAENQDQLQKWVYEHSSGLIGTRDMSAAYFDCTNYYFDISHPDIDLLDENGDPVDENGDPVPAKYRKRGPEKNHRPDPIVEMGLLIDRNGIPVAYDLFPGNESEKVHMRPVIERIKAQFTDTRIIFVADRGLNTSDNIYWMNGDNRGERNDRDGYVYGQSVRGADEEFKEWVLSGGYETDPTVDHDGKEVRFIHKSRIHPKTLHVNVTRPGRKKPAKKSVTIDQKQMVYYSEKYAKKQRTERAIMIERAKDMIEHPKKYDRITAKGSSSYVQNIAFDKSTGEILEGRTLSLDTAKIEEEEKYDGYYAIVTSELKLTDEEIRNIYRGLSRIEDSFKVTKTYFQTQPVYVRTNEHIDAHFATCFLALVLIRILEEKLERRFPAGQILHSMKKYNCTKIDANIWQFTYYDEILEACAKALGIELDRKYRKRQDIRKLLHY